MWGIRARRVGFLLAGILATVAATGCCCDRCKWLGYPDPKTQETYNLNRGRYEVPPDAGKAPQPAAQPAAVGVPGLTEQQWKEKIGEPPSRLTPERIKGGIY